MTLANLKSACAAILDVSVGDLTISGTDLFLIAANNARKNAELRHNFEYTRLTATLDIDGETGGDLADAVSGVISRSVEITGTLSPDATGTYPQTGTTLGAYPLYTQTGYYLYYDGDDWILTNSSTSTENCWARVGVSGSSPAGTYTAVGTNTGSPVVEDTSVSDFAGVREVIALTLTNANGTNIPIDFARADIPIERDRYELTMSDDYSFVNRYPSDAQVLARGGASTSVIQRGTKLFIYPLDTVSSAPLAVTIEGYGWLNDYVTGNLSDANPTDFLIQHGFTYMQWHIVCELNYVFQRFVPRQEGVLSAPEQARENAWRDLILWDTYLVAGNTTVTR